jgi:hypothetical protein
MASIACRFDFRDFAPGRAGASPAPRGVGARGWRRICSPDLFLSPTPPEPTSVSAGFLFLKTEYWDQLPSLSRSQNAKSATARFLRRGFPYGLSRGIPCSAYTTKYPIPTATHPRAIAADTVRQECDERTGKHRENEAGEDRDPLHFGSDRSIVPILADGAARPAPPPIPSSTPLPAKVLIQPTR